MKITHVLGVALAAIALVGCTAQVPPASVGIKFNATSGISEKLVRPQVLWLGLRDHLIVYPTSVHNATYTKRGSEGERLGDDSIRASTVEGSILPVDLTVSYHVDPANVLLAFQNFGSEDIKEIQREFIRWTTIYAVNAVSGKKSIFDLTSKDRATLGKDVKDVVAPILARWGLTVDDVFIGEVYPNGEVKIKVDERIAMKNALELARVGLQRATIDAETTLTNAKRDAEINGLLALQGEKVLELKRLELRRLAIERWDGHAPMLGPNNIPFTDIEIK